MAFYFGLFGGKGVVVIKDGSDILVVRMCDCFFISGLYLRVCTLGFLFIEGVYLFRKGYFE